MFTIKNQIVMTRIISIALHKGGTGKTTTTFSLGAGLSNAGKKVLLVDIDPQSNLTEHLGHYNPDEPNMYQYITRKRKDVSLIKLNENLFLIPSSLDLTGAETEINMIPNRDLILKRMLTTINQVMEFDFILIDCPQALNVLTLNALMASTEVLIPVIPESGPVAGINKLIMFLESIMDNSDHTVEIIGILFTMVQKLKLHEGVMEITREKLGDVVLPFVIRKNVALAEAIFHHKSIFDYSPTSNGASDYKPLVDLVLSKTM